MSKILRLADNRDGAEIFRCVKELAETHGEDAIYFKMSEDRFVRAFNKNFMKAHLYKGNNQEINGLVFHMKEYSIKFNNFGGYLEDLYLDSTCRGKGLSRRLLAELCEYLLSNNQKHLKIVVPKYLNLDNFYQNFGFVNHSDDFSLYLFESVDPDFKPVWAVIDELPNEIVFHKIENDNGFPVYKLDVSRGDKTYEFCCQYFFNSWGGFGILFSDFSGDTAIARSSDFKKSYETLLNELQWSEDMIKVLWWQASGSEQQLISCIESCSGGNLSKVGWRIFYLNEEGMHKLSTSVKTPQ